MDNNFDYDNAINFLLNNKVSNINDNSIILQDKIMNSNDFNSSMNYIEESLNLLYEKTRVLQDIINYSKSYLNNEIDNSIKECKDIFNSIENIKDISKNNNYIKFPISLINDESSQTDRNNKIIPSAIKIDNKLTFSNNTINEYDIVKMDIIRPNNSNNILDINNNTNTMYRSLYMTPKPKSDITESIVLYFNNEIIPINYINFNYSNCDIQDIIFTLENDKEFSLGNNLGFFKTIYAKKVTIKLKVKNYIKSEYNYNDSYYKDDFWRNIDSINTYKTNNIESNYYCYYLFGFDNLILKQININNECYFCSDEINIGKLKDNEYITLAVNDSVINGNIEYYILDGNKAIPILPENKTFISDEKIFYHMDPRFNIDTNSNSYIKKNGEIIDSNFIEAVNKNDTNLYTISYTPKFNNINKLLNSKIRVKVIIRNYDINSLAYNTFINSITIKKFGGGNLWINN